MVDPLAPLARRVGLTPRARQLLCLAAALAGCAHIEPPPGGPEDQAPPQLVATRPDTLARAGAFREPAVFLFDERISERGLEEAVVVSPRTSPVSVEHRGDELRVSLRRGWEAGQIYQVVVGPAVQDLFGNRLGTPLRLVFSTGPEIPATELTGTVVSRTTGAPETGIRVEAIRLADSLVYATPSDSAGGFAFAQIPEGEYRVRAFRDLNADRVLQDYEAFDTTRARIAVGAAPTVRLRVLQPDSTAPRVASVEPADSTVEVKFDDFLDPEQAFSPAQVRVLLADSSVVPVVEVSLRAGEAAGAGRRPGREEPEEATPPDTARAAVAPGAQPAQEQLPSQSIVVRLGRPLPPDTAFVVRVTGVRNLHGLVGGGEAEGETPPAPAPPAEAPPAEEAPPPPGPGRSDDDTETHS